LVWPFTFVTTWRTFQVWFGYLPVLPPGVWPAGRSLAMAGAGCRRTGCSASYAYRRSLSRSPGTPANKKCKYSIL
jgi:hypothetical protein